jgi:exosortase K
VKLRAAAIVVGVLIAWGIKRHYADAQADDLRRILTPTAALAGVMTGTAFAWQAGEGYLSRERLFLIEKSCAGVNFLIAAFGMLTFTLLHRVGSSWSAAGVLGLSLVAGYSAAVIVNAVRIALGMWLIAHPVAPAVLSAADLHRIEGIAVYFGGLALLYQLTQRLDRQAWPRTMGLPLTVYYAITLGVPIANGAEWSDAAFVRHSFVVLVVPLAAIACFAAASVAVEAGQGFFTRRKPT